MAVAYRASPQASPSPCCICVLYNALIRAFSSSRNPPLSSVQLVIQQQEQANKNNLQETLSTVGDIAKTVAELTAVVANVLQDVPYVNGIVGIVTQNIKIRDITLILLY